MDLSGGERQGGVVADPGGVQLVTVGEPRQAGVGVVAGDGQQFFGQDSRQLPVCRAYRVADRLLQGGAPAGLSIPCLGACDLDEGVALERGIEVPLNHVQRPLDRHPGRGATGRDPVAEPLSGLLEDSGELAQALDQLSRRLGIGRRDERGGDQLADVVAGHVVRLEFDEAFVDEGDGVAQLLVQLGAGRPVLDGQRGAVHGRQPVAQSCPPAAELLVPGRREILDPVVVAMVAENGGVGGTGLKHRLPVVLGQAVYGRVHVFVRHR